jgi:hypothetical protein
LVKHRLSSGSRLVCLVASLIGVSAAPGCKLEIEQGEVEPPPRPQGVPKNALWAGGADGGVFLIVRPVGPSQPDTYSAEIYNDHSGSRVHRGLLRLEPTRDAPFAVGEAASYSGWDGQALHLTDGRRLVRLAQKQ